MEFIHIINLKLQLVIDSRIILEYLDDAFPETSILPKEPYMRAKQRYYAIKLESVYLLIFIP